MTSTTISITIPQEIRELLQQEKNQSGLITKLLQDHYKFNVQNIQDANLKILQLDEKKKQMIELIEKEKERFVEIKTRTEDIEASETELAELRKNKREQLISNCIMNTKDIFNIIITREQAIAFLDSDANNIREFLNIPAINEDDIANVFK
jgi:hypothetical protein